MAQEHEGNEGFFKQAGSLVSTVYQASIRDGTVDAFLRQGANEIGAALKAFPDAVQVDEPGAVFNPLYSDIAADKRANAGGPQPMASAGLATPGEIAGMSSGSVHGDTQAASKTPLPSPGEIAGDQQPYRPEPNQGQDHAQGHGRGM
jgi:hypothetical protein